jgi:hypothetical protein
MASSAVRRVSAANLVEAALINDASRDPIAKVTATSFRPEDHRPVRIRARCQ